MSNDKIVTINTEQTRSVAKKLLDTQHLNIAKALSKEILQINSDARVSVQSSVYEYPVKVFVFDETMLPQELQKKTKSLHSDSFAWFNNETNNYEIYISILNKNVMLDIFNKEIIKFRGKTLNFRDDQTLMAKELALSTFRHELAHTKISSLTKLQQLSEFTKKHQIPFSIINILEDVRVNSFWNFDKKRYRTIHCDIFKVSPETLGSDKKALDILLPICVTLDDPKYHYLSPDYSFCKGIFQKSLNAKDIFEIGQIAKEFVDYVRKNDIRMQNHLQNSQQQNSQQQNSQQQNNNNNSNNQKRYDNGSDEEERRQNQAFERMYKDNNSNNDNDNDFDYDDLDFDKLDAAEEYDSSIAGLDKIEDYEVKSQDANEQKYNPAEELLKDEGDLLTAQETAEMISKELQKYSYAINEEGQIISKPEKESSEVGRKIKSPRTQRPSCVVSNSEHTHFGTNVSQNNYGSLNIKVVRQIFEKSKEELMKIFPRKKYSATSQMTYKLNERKLHSLPINPTLEYFFKKQSLPKKEPIKLFGFLDMSGSMSGKPLYTAKHLLANICLLQKEGFVDFQLMLHSTSSAELIDFKELIKEKNPLEMIGNLRTSGAEGIVNAVKHSMKSRNFIKKSRAVLFFTDACLTDNTSDIAEGIQTIKKINQNVVGLYTDSAKYSDLDFYFNKNIAVKSDYDSENKNKIINELSNCINILLDNTISSSQAFSKILSNPNIRMTNNSHSELENRVFKNHTPTKQRKRMKF